MDYKQKYIDATLKIIELEEKIASLDQTPEHSRIEQKDAFNSALQAQREYNQLIRELRTKVQEAKKNLNEIREMKQFLSEAVHSYKNTKK